MPKATLPDFTIDLSRFIDNPCLKGREDKFIVQDVKVSPILASWRESLFAHEWLDEEGLIKPAHKMSDKVLVRREIIEKEITGKSTLPRPVLGIGVLDNVEIGTGKDLFLCLAALGMNAIPVHIPKSHEKDFRIFIR